MASGRSSQRASLTSSPLDDRKLAIGSSKSRSPADSTIRSLAIAPSRKSYASTELKHNHEMPDDGTTLPKTIDPLAGSLRNPPWARSVISVSERASLRPRLGRQDCPQILDGSIDG